jgi:flagellar hook-basal body complex protein FliE
MSIIGTSLNASNALQELTQKSTVSSAASTESPSAFSDLLNQAITSVNSTESTAATENMSLLTGQNANIHNVVLAAEKAEIALQLTLQIRNKVLDAYNEMMRMQI